MRRDVISTFTKVPEQEVAYPPLRIRKNAGSGASFSSVFDFAAISESQQEKTGSDELPDLTREEILTNSLGILKGKKEEKNTDPFPVLLERSQIFEALGDLSEDKRKSAWYYRKSLEMLERSLQAFQSSPVSSYGKDHYSQDVLGVLWCKKGRIHAKQGNYDRGGMALDLSLHHNPYCTHTWDQRGLVFLNQDFIREGCRCFKASKNLNDNAVSSILYLNLLPGNYDKASINEKFLYSFFRHFSWELQSMDKGLSFPARWVEEENKEKVLKTLKKFQNSYDFHDNYRKALDQLICLVENIGLEKEKERENKQEQGIKKK